ncbi:MAG TPA: hypothetical protein VFZ61_20295, partial [Polyangiales bacterium]
MPTPMLLRTSLLAVLLSLWGACGGSQSASGAELKPLAVGSQVAPLSRVDHRGKVVSLRGEPAVV